MNIEWDILLEDREYLLDLLEEFQNEKVSQGDKDDVWDEIKQDKDTLLFILRTLSSQMEVMRVFDQSRKTVRYWVYKHNIDYKDYSNFEGSKEERTEVKKPAFTEHGSYFIIHTKKDGDVLVEKDLVRKFKKLYCQAGMTKRQCELELEIPRKVINAMWSSFEITHDDVPFLEEDFEKRSPKDLAGETIEFDKKLYLKVLQKKRETKAHSELLKMYKKEYHYDSMLDVILKHTDEIKTERKSFDFYVKSTKKNSLVLNITDWHKGKRVLPYAHLDISAGYDKDIFEFRKNKLIVEFLDLLKYHKPEKVYLFNYGDGPDNPNQDTYSGQHLNQDESGVEQIMSYVDSMVDLVHAVSESHPEVVYAGVEGNHSSGIVNWDVLSNKILEKLMYSYNNVEFDCDERKHKIYEIYNSNFILTHGRNIRQGKYTGENDILNMIAMSGMNISNSYIVQGHLHHERVEGSKYKHILLPSLVGGDSLSSDILYVSSRPAQMAFVVTPEGIKSEHHIYFD